MIRESGGQNPVQHPVPPIQVERSPTELQEREDFKGREEGRKRKLSAKNVHLTLNNTSIWALTIPLHVVANLHITFDSPKNIPNILLLTKHKQPINTYFVYNMNYMLYSYNKVS